MDRKYGKRKLKIIEYIIEILNKTSVIKIGISICLCISIIMTSCISVSAQTYELDTYYEIGAGNTTYSYDDLLSTFRANSITYKRNMLEYQIQALNGTLADENHSNINAQHVDILSRLEELEQTKRALIEYKKALLSQEAHVVTGSAISLDNTNKDEITELITEIDNQIVNIDAQILQYKSTKSTVETNLSEARLSKNISSFYSSYKSLIEQEAKKKLENEFLKQCYSLIIYQEQLNYYKAYHEYLSLIRNVDSIRYRYGLVTKIVLDIDEVNILHNERVINENTYSYNASINAIVRDTGIMNESRIKLPLFSNKKSYNFEIKTLEFINKNSGHQQILNYIRSYHEYKDYAKTSSYTSYRQNEMQIDYYKLQKQELQDSIRAYVIKAINSYEKAIKAQEASWKELQLKDNQYNTLITKHQYKRASQLEVAKDLYEKEAAKLAYYQSCYESIIWQDILDNCIYGATP